MKKDAYYFSHDSNSKDDPKCVMLIEQLGLEGYGIFWVLVETLRDQPNYKYPLSLLPAIARRYNSTAQKVETVVKNYDLFQFTEDEFFFSVSLMGRMEHLETSRLKKSLAGKKGNDIRWNNRIAIAEQSQSDSNAITVPSQTIASKVKKSKVNEIKEKKNIIDIDFFKQAIDEFTKMRKLIKKPMTEKAVSLLRTKLDKLATNDNEKILILNQSIENSWQGVFPLKTDGGSNGNYRQNNETSKKQSNTESEGDRLARRAAEKYGTNLEDIKCDF